MAIFPHRACARRLTIMREFAYRDQRETHRLPVNPVSEIALLLLAMERGVSVLMADRVRFDGSSKTLPVRHIFFEIRSTRWGQSAS